MDITEKKHLSKTLKEFSVLASKKYKRGIEQHGGKLWLKQGLIDEAMNEVIDLWAYLYVLKQQIKNKNFGKLKDKDNRI
jgi:hypothetical protein